MSYSLPELPYAYDALEPHFDKETMNIHHTKHHQAYVTKLNAAIEGTDAPADDIEAIIKNISKYSAGVRNNGGGHYNHSLFWEILSPTPKKAPEGKLAEVTAASLADELGMTKEGARQHLLKLEKLELIQGTAKSAGVGRPVTYYQLSSKGLDEFPDSHAQVTVDLLNSVRNLLGENALSLLITDREQRTYARYKAALESDITLESKLNKLAELRSNEGYMADWKKEDDAYYLIENHCPICAAAKACQGFCKAELKNFKQLIGEEYQVERVKHILSEDSRCVYKITSNE